MPTRQTIISGTADDPTNAGTAEYTSLMGDGNITWNTNEYDISGVIPTPGKLSNFKVGIKTAPGAGLSWTFTIRQTNADTALSVTISNTAVLSSLDTDEVVVAAGDKVCIKAIGTGTPTACAAVYWRCDFIPTTDGETILLSNTDDDYFIANYYSTLVGGKIPDVTEFDGQTLFPTGGTLKKFYVELSKAPTTGNSRIFTIRKNGEVTGLVVTISGTATTGNDTDPTHNVTIAAGDKITILHTESGTPAINTGGRFGITFLPTTQGEWITSATTDDLSSSTAVEYQHLNCGDSTLTGTETEQHGLAPETTGKAIYVNLATAPGNGNSWIFTLREALGSTGLTVTISNTNTSGNATIDEAVAADALVDTLIDARAGTNTSASQIAILFYNAPTAAVPSGTVYLDPTTGRRTQKADAFSPIKIDPTTGRRGTQSAFPKFLVRESDGTLRAKSA